MKDPDTGEVIGIITQKATGLTKQFDALLESFSVSIRVLKASQASGMQGVIAGIDPVQAFLASITPFVGR